MTFIALPYREWKLKKILEVGFQRKFQRNMHSADRQHCFIDTLANRLNMHQDTVCWRCIR